MREINCDPVRFARRALTRSLRFAMRFAFDDDSERFEQRRRRRSRPRSRFSARRRDGRHERRRLVSVLRRDEHRRRRPGQRRRSELRRRLPGVLSALERVGTLSKRRNRGHHGDGPRRLRKDMADITGIHHITAICGDPQENLDFYTGVARHAAGEEKRESGCAGHVPSLLCRRGRHIRAPISRSSRSDIRRRAG